jgi:hypothetical protein
VHVDLFVDDAEDSLPETAPSKSLAPQMGLSDADATTKIVGDEIGVGRQMYPILAGIYGNEFDPVDHKTLDSVWSMLSEIVHLLDASREGLLKVKGFGGHDVMFVRVPRSASDKSFNNTKSWVDQALKYNGLPHPTTFEVPSASQIICVDFTKTRSLQQWKSKECPLHNRCRRWNIQR